MKFDSILAIRELYSIWMMCELLVVSRIRTSLSTTQQLDAAAAVCRLQEPASVRTRAPLDEDGGSGGCVLSSTRARRVRAYVFLGVLAYYVESGEITILDIEQLQAAGVGFHQPHSVSPRKQLAQNTGSAAGT